MLVFFPEQIVCKMNIYGTLYGDGTTNQQAEPVIILIQQWSRIFIYCRKIKDALKNSLKFL